MSDIQRKKKLPCCRLSKSKKMKIGSVEEDFINYNSIPSLESIAIVNVATRLCKESDIRDKIRQHSLEFDPVGGDITCIRGDEHNDSLEQLKKSILNKLSLLPLPNLLRAKMANIITPIVFQMLDWIRYGRKDIEYMDSVCWTDEGTIDKVKTFEQLFYKDSAQHCVNSLFEFACTYCLEDYIIILWDKLPKKMQRVRSRSMYAKYENHLIAYWTSIVKNESSELLSKIKPHDSKDIYSCNNSIYQNMFKLAISKGNILAVKYFWNKLTVEEVNRNLAQWINDSLRCRKNYWLGYQSTNKYSDVLYFLLSQMDDAEQQKEIFQQNSEVLLRSLFLDWPWQRFLLPTIQRIWSSLDEKVYVDLLTSVVDQIKENKITEKLLRQLWHDSPTNLRKCFIQYIINDQQYGTDVVCNLLTVGDVETVKLMLNYATVEEKKQIIFSVAKNGKLYKVFYIDKLSLFDTLLNETVSSDSDIQDYKTKIMLKFGNRLCCDWIYEDNWKMVEKFLSWAFTSQNEIDNFKNNMLDKIEVVYRILRELGNYELVDKFLSWCFTTEQEINQFKRNFPKLKNEIVTIGGEDWGAFEKFLRWCFTSEDGVKDFKCDILQSDEMLGIIYDIIVYGYNFEFVDKLINWWCDSNEEIKQYKTKFVLSGPWISILQRFVSNYKVYDSDYSNLELTRKLIKLFFPLEEEVIIELKRLITANIDFDDFRGDYRLCSFPIEEEELFHLIDGDNYNAEDDDDDNNKISPDSNCTCADDDEVKS